MDRPWRELRPGASDPPPSQPARGAPAGTDAPGTDPLEGLDAAPWAELRHAYGSAGEVPALLRGLASGGEQRAAAMTRLHETIWHQGTTYEATSAAVPFLADLAVADESLLPELLFLLGAIADGTPYSHVGRPDPRSEAERELAGRWVADAREAVRGALPLLVDALEQHLTRPNIAGFCRLAYAFPGEPRVRAALSRAFESADVTPLDQAGIVMALLRGGSDEEWGDVVLLDLLVAAVNDQRTPAQSPPG